MTGNYQLSLWPCVDYTLKPGPSLATKLKRQNICGQFWLIWARQDWRILQIRVALNVKASGGGVIDAEEIKTDRQ